VDGRAGVGYRREKCTHFNREGKYRLGNVRLDWENNIKMDLERDVSCGLDSSGSTGSCEHGNKTPVSIKGADFFDNLSDYQLLKKDFPTRNRPQVARNNYTDSSRSLSSHVQWV
jgi:hypothetical protein